MTGKQIYHEFTDVITCPWCGCEDADSWEQELDESSSPEDLEYCDECDKGFFPSRSITVYYSTKKAEYGDCTRCGEKNVVIIQDRHRGIKNYCADKCYAKASQEHDERKYKEWKDRYVENLKLMTKEQT